MLEDILTILQTEDPLTTFLAFMVFMLAGVIWYLYKNTVPRWAYDELKERTAKNLQLSRSISDNLNNLITIVDERVKK